jgi:hypothetical protein
MNIIHVDGSLVAILIKETIYIIDMDNFTVHDQSGARLAIQNIDDWLFKNTLWAHGILNLKLFVNFFLQGRESIVIKDLAILLSEFVTHLFKNDLIGGLLKIYDVELLNLETIDRVVLPNLRDNFEAHRQKNGELGLELFLRRLRDRIAILNPTETRVIDSFLGRLKEQHVDIKMATPDDLINSASMFLNTQEVYTSNIRYPNIIQSFEKIKAPKGKKNGLETVLSS